MLQVLLGHSDRYSISEQAQMAIEGGCQWLVLQSGSMSDSDLREVARELVPLCTENQTILTLQAQPDIVRELGVHGILCPAGTDPIAVRSIFGAEAIIGAVCEDSETIVAYDKADIDYVAMTTPHPADIIAKVRRQGALIPFVALGDYSLEDAKALRMAGYDGVCTGRSIFEAPSPEDYVQSFLQALEI